jgi:hypothetical protein
MKDKMDEIADLRRLVKNAEILIQRIEALIPKDTHAWLPWRVRGLQRKLDDTKRDLRKLIEDTQIQIFEKANREHEQDQQKKG